MFCKQCGAQITEGVKFCKNCGAPVNTAGGDGPNPTIENSTMTGASTTGGPKMGNPAIGSTMTGGPAMAGGNMSSQNIGNQQFNNTSNANSVTFNIPKVNVNIFNLYTIISAVGILLMLIGLFVPFIKLNFGEYNYLISAFGGNQIKLNYMAMSFALGWILLLSIIAECVLMVFDMKVPMLCVGVGQFAAVLFYPIYNSCHAVIWRKLAIASGSADDEDLQLMINLFKTGAGFWFILIGSLVVIVAIILNMVLGELDLKKFMGNKQQPQMQQPMGGQPQMNPSMGAQPQMNPSMGAQPQMNQPMGAQPQMNQPMGAQPQMNQPMGAQPQMNQPMGAQPQMNQPMGAQMQETVNDSVGQGDSPES